MNYTKPEVRILGDAKSVIEIGGGAKPASPPVDGTPAKGPQPAYDLDE
jgi:hypothetical protein